jgi:hypothetical protein
MSAWGLVIMLLSVGGSSAWLGWCIYKVCTTPEETEKIHGFDTHTPDQKK